MQNIRSLNPYNNELIQEFSFLENNELLEKVQKAEDAFKKWRKTPLQEKIIFLEKLAKILKTQAKEFAPIITLEMGKPIKEAVSEIQKCGVLCEYYAKNAEQILKDEILDLEDGKALIAYQALGAVLGIMPWNFPFWQVFRFTVPALMAGNVTFLKHAPNVPQSALKIEEIFKLADFPEGTFQNLMIDIPQVETVIQQDLVQGVALTGSEIAGSAVASLAGKYIKKTILELGGSDPFIVFPEADLEKAAQMAIKSRMLNTGQSCIAAKRFLVHQDIAEKFQNLMQNLMQKLKVGNPMEIETDYAVLARENLAQKLLSQVESSTQLGAKAIIGGGRPAKEGAFFEATILAEIPEESPAFKEELFGPVASIFPFKTTEQALHIANNTPYGLGASIWSNDLEKAEKIAREIASGSVFINDMVKSDPRLPFGGIKGSGYGRELSYLGMREFINIQTIKIKT